MALSRRQKSWDILDQSALNFARHHKVPVQPVSFYHKSHFNIQLVF